MRFFPLTLLICLLMLGLGLTGTAQAAGGDMKLEAHLILGSNDSTAKGNPVPADIEKKLKRLPLKWQHYNVITTQVFVMTKDEVKAVSLGAGCEFTVKNLGDERVELTLAGRGKITQSLRKGQTLVTGGNGENCIVVLRQGN